jgi:hypothetical protein
MEPDAPKRKGANVASLMHMFEDKRSAGKLHTHEKLRVRLTPCTARAALQ